MVTFLDYMLIIVFTVFSVVTISTVYLLFIRQRPKIHILRKIGDTYQLVKTIKFKMTEDKKTYKNKDYQLDLKSAIFWKKNKPWLFFDINSTIPLSFFKIAKDAKMFKLLTDNSVLSSIFGKQTEKLLIVIVLLLVIALLLSVSFSLYVVSNPEQFINSVNSTQVVGNSINPVAAANP